jgi:hypothetical protein
MCCSCDYGLCVIWKKVANIHARNTKCTSCFLCSACSLNITYGNMHSHGYLPAADVCNAG